MPIQHTGRDAERGLFEVLNSGLTKYAGLTVAGAFFAAVGWATYVTIDLQILKSDLLRLETEKVER